jgi:uncharacterized membrane protein
MTKPTAPYPAEPTHGSQILADDRRRRIANRSARRRFHLIFFGSLTIALAATAAVLIVRLS